MMLLLWYESGVKAKQQKDRFEEISCNVVQGVYELIYLVKFLLYSVVALPLPIL